MQKPTDLEGQYTFFKSGGACPYGLGCRFSSTHEDGVPSANLNGLKNNSEVNGLSKHVQKLLWKNKMSFSKADAQLKSLGLVVCYLFFPFCCFSSMLAFMLCFSTNLENAIQEYFTCCWGICLL